ncbi:MAG TPA: hypothetical protein VFD71_18950, partial [Planctomycetota bacterium]|nr:hypothetical protein [Planctomycetota bacterium]
MPTNPGITLDRLLEKKTSLDAIQAVKVALQVAQQIGTSGDAFLIHPGRILVGKDGAVKLLPPPAEDLVMPVVVEYPAYVSPEEIRGHAPDVRSALYSLGCTLYALLTGAPPHQRGDPKKTLQAHLEDPLPDVRAKVPAASEALARALRGLLAKDPAQRLQRPED